LKPTESPLRWRIAVLDEENVGCDSEKLQAKAITTFSNVDAVLAIELLGKVPNPCERG
jgi:hypothetical protein